MKNYSNITTKRLAVLLASRFLLQTSSVTEVLKDFRRSIVLYISAAIFIILTAVVIFFEVYKAMTLNGFSYILSLNIMILFLVLSSLLCFFLARFFGKRAKNEKKFGNIMNNDSSSGLEKIAQSFLDGLFED